MNWCIRVDPDGVFRSATAVEMIDGEMCPTVTCFTLADWHAADPAAAEQLAPMLGVQRRFMETTGLDRRDAVNASLVASLT